MGKSYAAWSIVLPLLILICTPSLLAQMAPGSQTATVLRAAVDAQSARLAKLEQQIADAKSSADNAWMLTSAALVLMMTGPGLALFYGGLVRKKNVLATMMQSFAMMALVTVLWAMVGYSLAFGPGNSFIGGLASSVSARRGIGSPTRLTPPPFPQQTFMIYQLMFAIITPALITGAFAERMKFSAMVLFMVLWSILVYDPMAHMVWGKGGLAECGSGRAFPHAGFCRRHGGACHLRSFGAGVRALSGTPSRLSARADASAQRGAEFHRRVPAVGRLVWIQRGQRARRRQPWRPALLWPRILPRRPRSWDGAERSGCATASPVRWERFPARSRDWWPSLPPAGFVGPDARPGHWLDRRGVLLSGWSRR